MVKRTTATKIQVFEMGKRKKKKDLKKDMAFSYNHQYRQTFLLFPSENTTQ